MILSKNELESQNLAEFEGLLKEYVKLKPSKVIEIGSLYGWTLQHFIHYSNEGSTVVSIDLPVRDFVGPNDWRVAKQEDYYANVWPLWAKEKKCKLFLIPKESQNPSTLETAKEIFNNEEIDFLFIDGNHLYSAVRQDYEMYMPLVRKGGIVAFHDIGMNEEGGAHILWEEVKNKHSSYKEFLYDKSREKGIGMLVI
jgi:cephalosporin hydroxylase